MATTTRKKTTSSSSPRGTFKCPDCDRTFDTRNGLNAHSGSHSPARRRNEKVKCEVCGEMFSPGPGLAGHMKSHDVRGEKIIPPEAAIDPELQVIIAPLEERFRLLSDEKAALHASYMASVTIVDESLKRVTRLLRVAMPEKYGQTKKKTTNIPEGRQVASWRIEEALKAFTDMNEETVTVRMLREATGWSDASASNVVYTMREQGQLRLVGKTDGGGNTYKLTPAARNGDGEES